MEIEADITSMKQSDIKRKSTRIQKQFDLNYANCRYSNTQTLNINQSQKTSQLVVSNLLCKQTGNILEKSTHVQFGDRTLLIEDVYIIDPKPLQYQQKGSRSSQTSKKGTGTSPAQSNQNVGSQNSQKTKKFFFVRKKNLADSQNGQKTEYLKRDTKNIAKNFMRVFEKYLRKRKSPSISLLIEMINNGMKYNNFLIDKVISNADLCSLFEGFLTEQATEWIQNSKIRDKESHKQAIEVYMNKIASSKKNSTKSASGSNENSGSRMIPNEGMQNMREDFDIFKSSSS